MTKKIFAFIIACALIATTSFVFAANEIKDSMDKAGSTVQNVVNGAGEVVRDGAEAVKDGTKDAGDAIGNAAGTVGSDINRGMDQVTGNDNNGYNAQRTSADEATILGMNANTWTWFVLAIAALAIVALVWYYAMQNKTEYNNHKE